MKIPGIERDEDGTIVIEISPTMRLVALAGAMTLVGIVIWWVAIKKEETEQRKISRIPGNILKAEDFTEKPDALMEVEAELGVSPYSLLSIERVAGADREELEKIFEEILSTGLPDLRSEEAELYKSLVARSAAIAPNRALRFYDMLEGGNQRAFSISQLYKKWIELEPTEAVATAKLIEEPLRFHSLSRDLPALAQINPAKAFEAALLTRNDYFQHIEPDFVRPVVRIWGKNAFSAAETASLALDSDKGRREAVQGLALAQFDLASQWGQGYAWASGLKNSQDRVWAQLTLVELGIHHGVEGMGAAVANFPHQTLKQHLLRLVEARRVALGYSEEERHDKTRQLFRSTDPYDTHGRLCVLNTFENTLEREGEAINLRSRWPEVAVATFVADSYLLSADLPYGIKQRPLVNLLERGDRALAKGDLESSRADFTTYLHYNPEDTDLDPYFTRWSKKAGTWLGVGATSLDEITVPPAVISEGSPFFDVMDNLAAHYRAKTGKRLEFFIFEAISGIKPEVMFASGEHGEVSLREALDKLTMLSGLVIHHKEYGIVGYFWRDEDMAMSMGASLENIPYMLE